MCAEAFDQNVASRNTGLGLQETPNSSRKRTIQQVEAVLRRNEGLLRCTDDNTSQEYSVFDLHNANSDTDELNLMDGEPTDDSADAANDVPANAVPPPLVNHPEPDHTAMSDFYEYCERAKVDYISFDADMMAAVELMSIMNNKGGSLGLYEAISEWHVSHRKAEKCIPSAKLHSTLVQRYDMEGTMPYEVETKLPFSNETVNLACHDALAQMKDLLTDPRIARDDYQFWNGDPESAPSEEFVTVGDVNTGRAMRQTYHDLIAPRTHTLDGRRRVPLGLLLYVDACQVGQYQGMAIEIMKFTLSIFKAETREKDCAWRNLGYLPNRVKGKVKASTQFKDSIHLDSERYKSDPDFRKAFWKQGDVTESSTLDPALYGDGNPPEMPEVKAQDLHVMLKQIMGSYKQVEDKDGIDWDLRHVAPELAHLSFVPFVLLLKVDGVEADKCCGQYLTKSGNVACLCRACMCPTHAADKPYLTYELKTKPMIQDLVKNGEVEKLKKMSQQNVWNAFYDLRFGTHNDRSVHGATPMEPLHWIQLNGFGYTRSNLFEQLGPSSDLATTISAIAMSLGDLLRRQSERDMPRTSFQKGVQDGKVMAHEMGGVILVLDLSMRTTKGRNALLNDATGAARQHFPSLQSVKDWMLLFESQLKFERWLNKPTMEVELVKRARTKFSELMQMNKHIAKRESGMQFKTLQFHGYKHVPDDILDYGVPSNYNTKCNEMHHKRDKKTALRTQRQIGVFDMQCATKIQYRTAIDYAMEELKGRPKWKYLDGFDHCDRVVDNGVSCPFPPLMTGVESTFFKKPGTDDIVYRVMSSMKRKDKFQYDESTLQQIHDCLHFVYDYLNSIKVYTELRVHDSRTDTNRQLYRASPYMQGLPWNDWAMFDLSKPENPQFRDYVPCQLMCFIDLTELPQDNGLGDFEPGMYCILEAAHRNPQPEEQGISQLWEPWIKLPHTDRNLRDKYSVNQMVNLTRLRSPCTVVPDLENVNNRAYLRMVPRSQWPYLFDDWLEAPHTREYDEDQFP